MPDKLRLTSWESLKTWLTPQVEQGRFQIVSLDIFDTLVARIDLPEHIQRQVCRQLATQVTNATPQQVFQARQQAENSLREQALQQGFDHECCFSDLVPLWIKNWVGYEDPVLMALAIELELQAETTALYIKKDVIDFLEWLKGFNLNLLAISDMYLDSQYIAQLLENLGLKQYFSAIYVSSDSKLGKHSGRLFEYIKDKQALDYQAWVHIGDNPHSDRLKACELGIQGIWLDEKDEVTRISQQRINAQMAERGGVWRGRYLAEQIRESLQVSSPKHTQKAEYFDYGREVLGIAFSTFMLGLLENLAQTKPDCIFFIARDGYLFQQMLSKTNAQYQQRYLYLSRQVIAAASVAEGLTLQQAQVAFYNPKQQGLSSIFKVYSLSHELLAPLAKKYDLHDISAPIHDWNDKRLLNWLADPEVQAIIRHTGLTHKQTLQAYLKQEGFFDYQHVAMVDIGWNGTLQHFLTKTFEQEKHYPEVSGFYFALVPKLHNDFYQHNQAEGIIYDSRRSNACERVVAEFEEVFEQGARALHGSTIGYSQDALGSWQPLLKADSAPDRAAEIRANPYVEQIQAGVLDYWQHFQKIQQLTGFTSHEILPFVYGTLERAVVYPTPQEVKLIRRLVHTEDFGHDHVLTLAERWFQWRDLLSPKRFWQYLQVEAWRYAVFSHLPTGIANFALRIAYLHAVKK
ncbi:HAD family hydrolase [Thiofilum flexile]|uniref:HAD family hydrolase n=1 Tax=Thiofilum flexile TaxID=125627 RepID=UPI00036DA345|nr:HAD family hydrolase [Thiofilum flexile]